MWYTVFFELTFELLTIPETVYRKAIHLQQFIPHTNQKHHTNWHGGKSGLFITT